MTKKHKKICEKIWMERNDYLGAIKEAFEAGMKEGRKTVKNRKGLERRKP